MSFTNLKISIGYRCPIPVSILFRIILDKGSKKVGKALFIATNAYFRQPKHYILCQQQIKLILQKSKC